MLLIPIAVAAVAALFLFLLWAIQRRLLYFPASASPLSVHTVFPNGEDAVLQTGDGLSLGAWFVPPAHGATGAAVIVFNGNAGSRDLRAPLARSLSDAGVAVLLFDYRGYAGNPGSPSENGLASDARAAVTYLAARDDVRPDRIAYFGESLGGAVAVALALEHPPAALILRSPFTSVDDIARVHYPFVPAGPFLKDHYPSIDRIARIHVPVLVVAGENDRIVPAEQSRRLYQAASDPKQFVLIPGADHNDWQMLASERPTSSLSQFLRDHTDLLEASAAPVDDHDGKASTEGSTAIQSAYPSG